MLLKEYHQALTGEFGVEGYSYEQCLKDYKFQVIPTLQLLTSQAHLPPISRSPPALVSGSPLQVIKPFFQLLIMAPALAKQRDRRVGMFATPLSKGSQKLTDMCVLLLAPLAPSDPF